MSRTSSTTTTTTTAAATKSTKSAVAGPRVTVRKNVGATKAATVESKVVRHRKDGGQRTMRREQRKTKTATMLKAPLNRLLRSKLPEQASAKRSTGVTAGALRLARELCESHVVEQVSRVKLFTAMTCGANTRPRGAHMRTLAAISSAVAPCYWPQDRVDAAIASVAK